VAVGPVKVQVLTCPERNTVKAAKFTGTLRYQRFFYSSHEQEV
jgi:hypothetical protein